MVEVKNLSKFFKTRKEKIFDVPSTIKAVNDISFTIEKGRTLGLVGESGSGKTTAVRSLMRLVEPEAGTITIDNTDVMSLDRSKLREFRKKIQIVFQDPYSSLNPRMTVEKCITEPIRLHEKLSRDKIRKRASELLEYVGLSQEHLDRYPHEFSGGQRQRIGIARAISVRPKLLILDEPVSALDVSIQGQILNLLKELQKDFDLTYLFVAHDLAVVEHMSDRIAVMYLGKIVEEGPGKEIYLNPRHPYTKSLIESVPEIKPGQKGFNVLKGEIPSPEDPPDGCHFHPRCKHAMDICRKKYPRNRKKDNTTVACHLYNE